MKADSKVKIYLHDKSTKNILFNKGMLGKSALLGGGVYSNQKI